MPDTVILTGCCVDTRTQSPIAGCQIFVSGTDPAWPDIKRNRANWRVDPARTDADGRFRLELTPPVGLWYDLGILADGYVLARRSPKLAPGSEEDLGVIQLRRGGRIIGRVIDTTGAPRAAVSFGLRHCESEYRDLGSSRCTSRDDGTFATNCLLPGTWSLEVDDTVPLRSPLVFEVPDDASDAEVTVVLFAEDEVPHNEGVVVDEGEQPIPDVVLRMRRAPPAAIELTVVDDSNGEPIEAFDAICVERIPDRDEWYSRGWVGLAWAFGPHPLGRTRLAGVTPGERTLLVRARGDRSALVHATTIALAAEGAALVVRLPPPAERWLEVVAPDGAPVADSLVELLLPLDERPLALMSPTVDGFDRWSGTSEAAAVLLQAARTDRDGRVLLRGPPERPLGVRIVGPGPVPEMHLDVRLAGAPLRLTVRRGGSLIGRLPAALRAGLRGVVRRARPDPTHAWHSLTPTWPEVIGYVHEHFDPDAFGLRLESPGREPPLPSRSDLFPVDPDGRFLIEGIEPGRWQVRLRVPTLDDSGAWMALGPVLVREGRSHRLEIDGVRLEPGTVRGTLRADGRPLAHRILGFLPLELWVPGALDSKPIAGETDAHGRFEVRLLAGRWRPALIARGVVAPNGTTDWIRLPGDVEVRPGDATDADLAFAPRRLTVRVVDAADEPIRFVRVRVAIGTESTLRVSTDCDGRFVVDPLIGDAPLLEVSEDRRTGSLRVPAEPSNPELTVVLQ